VDINQAEEAYHSNPEFRVLVDTMINAIETLKYSPVEMRSAATFASIVFERSRPYPSTFYPAQYLGKWERGTKKQYQDRHPDDWKTP